MKLFITRAFNLLKSQVPKIPNVIGKDKSTNTTNPLTGSGLGLFKNFTFPSVNGIFQRLFSSHEESDNDIICRYVNALDNCNIDGWDLRTVLNNLAGEDMVPHPVIIQAALRACRRNNDYALTVRVLESAKHHCGPHLSTIYPYILKEIECVLDELGCDTPEDLCYDVPELGLPDVFDPKFAIKDKKDPKDKKDKCP